MRIDEPVVIEGSLGVENTKIGATFLADVQGILVRIEERNTNGIASWGVLGECEAKGTGVIGVSRTGVGVHGRGALASGVIGEGETGVVGRGSTGVSGEGSGDQGVGVIGDGPLYGGMFRSSNGQGVQLALEPSLASGPPTTGSHNRGEFFVDIDGALFYNTEDGEPGNWKRIALLDI